MVLALLAVVYVGVSVIAYTDYPRADPVHSLTDLEREGMALWRRHNCQACHQIYGFGGFLGPDLTNRVTDETPDSELGWLLRSGSGAMPAFDLSVAERTAVLAYLREINRTGQSQPAPRFGSRAEPGDLQVLADEWVTMGGEALAEPVQRGCDVWRDARCGTCHLAFREGRNRAPDLTGRARDVSAQALHEVLGQGRRRMPAFSLASGQIDDLSHFLEWAGANRSSLVELGLRRSPSTRFAWSQVPWFEYR